LSRTRLLNELEKALYQLDHAKLADSKIELVILFGSRARTEHSVHSDYDLLVLGDFPRSWNILKCKTYVEQTLFGKQPFIGDILIASPKEFLKALDDNRGIALDIAQDGKVIFDKHALFPLIRQKFREKTKKGLRRGTSYWYWKTNEPITENDSI